jgi:hypothetical protein
MLFGVSDVFDSGPDVSFRRVTVRDAPTAPMGRVSAPPTPEPPS